MLNRQARENKKSRNQDRSRKVAEYQTLEARNLLAGIVGSEPTIIVDAFAPNAVTVKQMIERAETNTYIAGELVVAIQTQTAQGPHAISSINWEELTGIVGTTAKTTLMSVERGQNQTVSLVQLNLGKDGDLFAAMTKLDNYRRIMWSSPNFSIEKDPREFVPNDPSYSSQYHHQAMNNELAWDYSLGSPDIIIAITDDGVSLSHPDLAANIYHNMVEGALPDGIDNDGNGYVDDYNGWDFSSGNNNPNPNSTSDSHGTHVSGIAAGRTNNAVGIAGVSGGSTILPLQFYGVGSWTAAVINQTFTYAANNGANIVNTSYNIDGWVGDPVFTAGLQYMYDHDVLHFNSAGNNSALNPPRQIFDQTLFVASTNQGDGLSSFSNYGTGIDIAAPGGAILSTVTGNTYDTYSGTSMATPNAAGAAALIWSAHPTWTRDQVAAQLYATADNIDAQNPTRVGLLGGGRVNTGRGVTETLAAPQVQSIIGLPANGGYIDDTTIDSFTLKFNQIMDPASVNNSANFELRGAGADELFDTADDQVLTLTTNNYRLGTNQLNFVIDEGALSYGDYRFTLISGGLQNPFGTALDGDGNGTAGDSFVSVFHISAPPLGTVNFNRANYQLADLIEIVVADSNAVEPLSVTVTSSGGDTETVTLAPQGFGKYLGTINTSLGAATSNDGTVQVSLGQTLTVTYDDVDDGSGLPATATDEALISNIRQYDSADTPINITDNNTITSVIHVADAGVAIDVNVMLDITHTYDADLDVFLISPTGTRIELFTDVGGSGNDFTQTTIDDQASQSITNGTAPFTGVYSPEGSLAALNGLAIAGDWTLEITDDAGGDIGSLNTWSLLINVGSLDQGRIELDQPFYNPGDAIAVTVNDANATHVNVNVSGSNGESEVLTLSNMGGGVFSTSIATVEGLSTSGDGILQVAPGTVLTFEYLDIDDGSGFSNLVSTSANIQNIFQFVSNDIPITISDNATFTSEIVITEQGTIADLNVNLDITHTYDGDLELTLIAPDGSRVVLANRNGGSGNNFTNTTFDDEAATAISAGVAPFTGSYRPVGNLSAIDSISITGTWILEIADRASGDVGSLNAWSLSIDVIPSAVFPDISVADIGSVIEGDSDSLFSSFIVSLSEPTTQSVFVDFATTNTGYLHAATPGEDFATAIGTLEFLPGETTKTIQVEIYGDVFIENHEQFGVLLGNATGGQITNALGSVTISDNEAWVPRKALDFGPFASVVPTGNLGVNNISFATDRKVGWSTIQGNMQFLDTGVGNSLQRDYALFSDATFEIGTGTGIYAVTIGLGSSNTAHDNMRISIGGRVVDVVSTAAGEFYSHSFPTRASGGSLLVRVEDLGGSSNDAALNFIQVTLKRPFIVGGKSIETTQAVLTSTNRQLDANDGKVPVHNQISTSVARVSETAVSKSARTTSVTTTDRGNLTEFVSINLINEISDELIV